MSLTAGTIFRVSCRRGHEPEGAEEKETVPAANPHLVTFAWKAVQTDRATRLA